MNSMVILLNKGNYKGNAGEIGKPSPLHILLFIRFRTAERKLPGRFQA